MRRSLAPALLLLLTTVAPACAHQSSDSAPLAPEATQPAVEAESEPESDGAELETAQLETDTYESVGLGASDPNVISFEDDITAGPADAVIAPPKREDIAGFALFGTGESMDHDGPKLTLPDDVE